jgi:hypothetical protein
MDANAHQRHATNLSILTSVRLLLANQPPEYGTPAWDALPCDHPDRTRAVWEAAEAWCRYWKPEVIAERLRTELDFIDRVTLERFKTASVDVSRVWDASRLCAGPTHAELRRRRALVSRLACGICRRPVDVVHPLPDELAARLPDTSLVRCAAHESVNTREEVAA